MVASATGSSPNMRPTTKHKETLSVRHPQTIFKEVGSSALERASSIY